MPSVALEVSEDMMFAKIVNFNDASTMDDEAIVSVKGTVRKVTYIKSSFYC